MNVLPCSSEIVSYRIKAKNRRSHLASISNTWGLVWASFCCSLNIQLKFKSSTGFLYCIHISSTHCIVFPTTLSPFICLHLLCDFAVMSKNRFRSSTFINLHNMHFGCVKNSKLLFYNNKYRVQHPVRYIQRNGWIKMKKKKKCSKHFLFKLCENSLKR